MIDAQAQGLCNISSVTLAGVDTRRTDQDSNTLMFNVTTEIEKLREQLADQTAKLQLLDTQLREQQRENDCFRQFVTHTQTMKIILNQQPPLFPSHSSLCSTPALEEQEETRAPEPGWHKLGCNPPLPGFMHSLLLHS